MMQHYTMQNFYGSSIKSSQYTVKKKKKYQTKKESGGSFLAAQRFALGAVTARPWVQALIRGLRS